MTAFIRDLARAVALFQPKNKPAYFPRKTIAGDYDKLFSLAQNSETESEEATARALYGEEGQKAMGRYYTLKSRLKDRLENSVFFFSPETALSERESRRYGLWKRRITAWALWKSGATESATREWEKIAEEAERYGWNDVCIETYSRIRLARARQGSAVLWKKYDDALSSALRRQSVELGVESALAEIEIFKSRETLLAAENVAKCQAALERAEAFAREYPLAYRARAFLAKAQYLLAEARGDFAGALRLTESARENLRRSEGGLDSETAAELDAAALCYALLTRNIEACRAVAARRLAARAPLSETIAPRALDYWFLTATASASFGDIAAALSLALARRAELSAAPQEWERWKIREAYARFLLSDGDLPERPTFFKPRFSPRALARSAVRHASADAPVDSFANSSEMSSDYSSDYSSDHSSANSSENFSPNFSPSPDERAEPLRLAYGILRVIVAVQERDWSAAEGIIAELEPFRERYLRKDAPHYRAQCFLRMLFAAAAAGFDAEETRRKTQSYAVRLAEARAFDLALSDSPELVPFERLWKYFLTSFADKTTLPAPTLRRALAEK
jgi:hypothetical protein